jgi:hypothetical protein
MKLASTIATLTLAIAGAYSAGAIAQEAEFHASSSQAVARCQSSLPVFDTAIRKRPLAVQNEGDGNSFVTCGFEFDGGEAEDFAIDMAELYVHNNNEEAIDVTCTAVTGWQGGDTEYVSLTHTVPAGDQEAFFWGRDDFPGDGLATGLVGVSCNLPAGTGINDTYVYWFGVAPQV